MNTNSVSISVKHKRKTLMLISLIVVFIGLLPFDICTKALSESRDLLTDYQKAQDKMIFDAIDALKPNTERTVLYCGNGYTDGSSCHISAITTLLNRRLKADGYSGCFTVGDVYSSLGFKNPRKLDTSTESKQRWTSDTVGNGSGWCSTGRHTYRNGNVAYTVTKIEGSTIRKDTGWSCTNITAALAKQLHDHPEGIAVHLKDILTMWEAQSTLLF